MASYGGRRSVLSGATDQERESRHHQQQDYAAQLQEQVRQKNERAEQEKLRKRQEQQAEREMMDRERATQAQGRSRHHQQQQQEQQQQQQQLQQPLQQPKPNEQQQYGHPPPQFAQRQEPYGLVSNSVAAPPSPSARSPTRLHGSSSMAVMPHTIGMPSGSPSKAAANYHEYTPPSQGDWSPSYQVAPHVSPGVTNAQTPTPLVAPFEITGPSIFEALLRPEPATLAQNAMLDEQLQALRNRRMEIDTAWKQHRAAMQSNFAKPNFILTPPPSVASTIPLSEDEKRQLDEDIALSLRAEEPPLDAPRLPASVPGLIGESVLIPLVNPVKPVQLPNAASSPSSASPSVFQSRAVQRSHSPVRRQIPPSGFSKQSAVLHSTSSLIQDTDGDVLRHDSKLLDFNSTV